MSRLNLVNRTNVNMSHFTTVENLAKAKPIDLAKMMHREKIDPVTFSDGFVNAVGKDNYTIIVNAYNRLTNRVQVVK